MTFNEYKIALRQNKRHNIFKIEFMDINNIVVDEITTDWLSGNISIELKNGTRRTCSLELCNDSGKYIPSEDNIIYLGKKCKVYTGLNVNGNTYYNSQGIFNLCNPILTSLPASKKIKIEGIDDFSLLNGNPYGKLPDTYTIPLGTNIASAVLSLINISQITESPIIYPTSEVLPYTVTKEAGSTIEDLILELAEILSWATYIDNEGHFHFEPQIDEIYTYPIWEFLTSEVTYLGGIHEYKFLDVRNSIKVIGSNINGDLATGISQDTNIFSPTNINKIGEIWDVITDSNIYSDDLAKQRADYELKQKIQIYESIDITSIPVDFLDVGDIITIQDVSNGNDMDNFLIKQINREMGFDKSETLNVWKTRAIS